MQKLLPLSFLFAAVACFAEPVPFSALKMSSSVDTEQGTYGLWAWADREKFPEVAEFNGLKESNEKPGRVSWQAPVGNAAGIDVSDEAIALHSNGRSDHSVRYRWAPMLLFRPTKPGVFQVKGTVTIKSDNAKDADTKIVRWAVVRLVGEKFTVVTEGWGKRGEAINLGTLSALSEISVGADEQIGFTAWRGVWHWNGTARSADLEFVRVK